MERKKVVGSDSNVPKVTRGTASQEPGSESVPTLLEALESNDDAAACRAASILLKLPEAAPHLVRLFSVRWISGGEQKGGRQRFIVRIRKDSFSDPFPIVLIHPIADLVKGLAESRVLPVICSWAARLLGELGSSARPTVPSLWAALAKPCIASHEIVKALGRIGGEESLAALKKLLLVTERRKEAILALASTDGVHATPILLELLRLEPAETLHELQYTVLWYLMRRHHRTPGDERPRVQSFEPYTKEVLALAKQMLTHGSDMFRCYAFNIAAGLGSGSNGLVPEALAAVENLAEPRFSLRQAIALLHQERVRDVRVIRALPRLLTHDDRDVRAQAAFIAAEYLTSSPPVPQQSQLISRKIESPKKSAFDALFND